MSYLLSAAYPWIKVLHLVAVVSWMAGLLYLPRLFVYHAERGVPGSELSETFKVMEARLLRGIMRPAMIATWVLGLSLVGIGGWWSEGWLYAKLAVVVALSGFHDWLARRCGDFATDRNRVSGRTYRLLNEVPIVALAVIAALVIIKPF